MATPMIDIRVRINVLIRQMMDTPNEADKNVLAEEAKKLMDQFDLEQYRKEKNGVPIIE